MNDYISRRDAISWFRAFMHTGEDSIPTETVLDDLAFTIPASDVEPVQHWIPCSERLPEKTGEYLVANSFTGGVSLMRFYKRFVFTYGTIEENVWVVYNELPECRLTRKCKSVTHWLPFPEPPRKEE